MRKSGEGEVLTRCRRCSNGCFVELLVSRDGIVADARRVVPGRGSAALDRWGRQCGKTNGLVGVEAERAIGIAERRILP